MKTLYESLLDDNLVEKTDEMIRDEIEAFLKEKYAGSIKISRKPNADGKYEVSSTTDIAIKNTNINSPTNGMFIWATVYGNFIISHCNSLTSLEGAPKEVGGTFDCSMCNSLKSLEGAPKEIGGSFDCSYCKALTLLDGAPKKVGRNFYCDKCASQFTIEDVKKISNVKGKIIC